MIENIIIFIVFSISFILSIALGAGSTGSTPFAPAVGANTITTLKAALIVGIISFFGAILQGQNIADTIGNDLIKGVTLAPAEISVVLLIGALFMFVGIKTGYPIATAFTFTAAFVGAGMAIGGSPVYEIYFQILVFWAFSPIIGILISYVTIKSLLYKRIDNNILIPILLSIVLVVIFNIPFKIPTIGMISLHEYMSNIFGLKISLLFTIILSILVSLAIRTIYKENTYKMIDYFLIFLGGIVGFSAGASQVGIAVGALIPITESTMISYVSIFYLGGIGLLIGAWLMAPKMIKSVSQDYASLGPRRSISALFSAFVLAQIAVQLGFPISFNQIIISSIIGSGLGVNKGDKNVDKQKILYTVIIWILTIIASYLISYYIISII